MRVQAETVKFVYVSRCHAISDGKVFSGKSGEILKALPTGRTLAYAGRGTMKRRISWLISIFVSAVVWFWCAGYVQAQSPGTDPVLEWNANTLQAISTATSSGLIHSRLAAIVHVSIFDAVNSFTGDVEPYGGVQVNAPAGASLEAAVIAAAHFCLVHLLPDQQATLDAQYASSLAARRLTTSDLG